MVWIPCARGWHIVRTIMKQFMGVLLVPGLEDSADTAARLAKAKHLLETYLTKPLILKSEAKEVEKLIPLLAQRDQQFAAASD